MFNADWAAQVAAHWLLEIYSSCRLWHLPKLLFLLIRELWDKLYITLGGEHNLTEFRNWLDLLQDVDWDNPECVPRHWHCRHEQEEKDNPSMDDRFLGRQHTSCGDFIYLHPWDGVRISKDEAKHYLNRNRPRQPRCHPTGYIIADDVVRLLVLFHEIALLLGDRD